MRKSFYFALFTAMFALSAVSLFAQIEKQVERIRRDVDSINKASAKYAKKTKNVEGISLEGAEATYFVSGAKLKKVSAKLYGETYNALVEIYYSGAEIIFAFLRENRYDTQIGTSPPPKIARIEEKRFYFSGGELIRLLDGKTEVKPGAENYDELKAQIADISAEIRAAY